MVPFIKNEEEKLQEEVGKLLGRLAGGGVELLDAKLSAHCNRVAVEDGHTECVSVKLRSRATREEILAAWAEFAPLPGRGAERAANSRSNTTRAVDWPQPRLDRMRGQWHGRTVGRLRECNLLDWKFVVLSHNTIRGAAGAAVLNAEVLARLGKLDMKPARCGAGMSAARKTEERAGEARNHSRRDEVWRDLGGGR